MIWLFLFNAIDFVVQKYKSIKTVDWYNLWIEITKSGFFGQYSIVCFIFRLNNWISVESS